MKTCVPALLIAIALSLAGCGLGWVDEEERVIVRYSESYPKCSDYFQKSGWQRGRYTTIGYIVAMPDVESGGRNYRSYLPYFVEPKKVSFVIDNTKTSPTAQAVWQKRTMHHVIIRISQSDYTNVVPCLKNLDAQ
ncbi:MAG: hypothetical protein A2676_01125 [Candidatus Sungbacteria bacterium RIFCSPHIGHO2_01_FULL_51_22]|uniref:Uncharacterized protein n=1 Tax=Candidatus Sungbacteria bacterium RIFCSPHIGHO2_02_FULL_51_29 TaxID=1802273 RepID=A0A1G2KQG0_9BACT|nr:MAG: hypothetical protein A2676_01125 [Candidatus Sungbacteria bacterium RIFCSPHIGHO2_01_FULL_51_22]OHA01658.1 MAG: hypothetical protein A3C16_04380 [Candidatus Sungbacteria bacterium RIFCSPHIGHO2_02_FULL_51_29]OHA06398.1 MAG: hypothetical protein A3B29_05190 [Candidatus Sungbacteria bacterium RIFCSPLOWO2_01_FULL_51_34]